MLAAPRVRQIISDALTESGKWMDILHIGTWPTPGSTRKCTWSGSSRTVGYTSKLHPSRYMSQGAPHTKTERDLSFHTGNTAMASP